MSTLQSRVKTRFLVLSDTHSASPAQNAFRTYSPFRPSLPKADVLLHCGDLTMVGLLDEYEDSLQMLRGIDAELKLVIAGNHDISLDGEYYARKGQYMQRLKEPDEDLPRKARELWTGEAAKQAGVNYLDEGTYTFTLRNGARLRVYASPYQPEFCDWAFPYWRNQDRYNPPHQSTPGSVPIAENPVPDFPAIDVMMTHGPPMGVRDEVAGREEHVGCQHLLRAARRCRPQLHCFGHIHEAWGAERVKWKEGEVDADWEQHVTEKVWIDIDESKIVEDKAAVIDVSSNAKEPLQHGKETLMVNASIMSHRYKPVQGPWLVDLDLERI